MTLSEIKAAVLAGKTVCCGSDIYKVTVDAIGQWHIRCDNGYCIGLTRHDGITLNDTPESFYVLETK